MTQSLAKETPSPQLTTFGREVLMGLESSPKSLSSKWFYDEKGDKLFQRIMDSPEYYLTEAELEIFRDQADRFLAATGGLPFDLVELGAGDGSKTQHLLEYFIYHKADFRYLPIDISKNALTGLTSLVKIRWPDLPYEAIQGDYFHALANLPGSSTRRSKLVLFPGANIGNFATENARTFLNKLRQQLAPDDTLVIGFDLKKDPTRILAAYNDARGVTAQFNLNLLERINRELGGNFQLEKWQHWPTYDPISGACRSFLVSKEKQTVRVEALKRSFDFATAEAIDMEISQKYSLSEIEALAEATGYQVAEHLTDDKGDFVNSIWRV